MSLYNIPTKNSIPAIKSLRDRARRAGYRVAADRYSNTFTLVDMRLHRPVAGLDHVELDSIANALDTISTERSRPRPPAMSEAALRRAFNSFMRKRMAERRAERGAERVAARVAARSELIAAIRAPAA
jgi:hypothetical protein